MCTLHRSAVAVLALAGLAATLALTQPGDKPKPAPKAPDHAAQPETKSPGMPSPEDMAKMMETYTKAAAPGPMHKHLTDTAGTWDGKVKMWHVPGMPAQE